MLKKFLEKNLPAFVVGILAAFLFIEISVSLGFAVLITPYESTQDQICAISRLLANGYPPFSLKELNDHLEDIRQSKDIWRDNLEAYIENGYVIIASKHAKDKSLGNKRLCLRQKLKIREVTIQGETLIDLVNESEIPGEFFK